MLTAPRQATVPNDGLIRYRGLFNQERLLVTSPKALSEVLVTHSYDFQKPSSLTWSIGRILGIGLVIAEGNEHKIQRKNLNPAFAFRHVKDLYPVFWEKGVEGMHAIAEVVRAGLEARKSGRDEEEGGDDGTVVLELGNWASRTTLDIIGVAGMGRDFGSIKDPTNELSQTYQKLFRPSRSAQILALIGLFLPPWLVGMLPVKRNGDVRAAAAYIRSVCRDMIREKRERLLANGKTSSDDVDILSVAIESGGFTEENLVDQMMTFLAAGHETTSTSLQWAVYMLCLFPEVQAKLRAEVRANLPRPESGKAITALDIDRLPYLAAVCNEVLRYYSPVPMTIRETVTDTTVTGVRVPRGTRVIVSAWATNKDVLLWGPDATKFNPDRWLAGADGGNGNGSGNFKGNPNSGGATSNYAFLTFLHGPRSCIGQGFAKAEFACVLASWIGRFEFSLKNREEYDEGNMVIKGGITARPAKGLWVKVREVDGW